MNQHGEGFLIYLRFQSISMTLNIVPDYLIHLFSVTVSKTDNVKILDTRMPWYLSFVIAGNQSKLITNWQKNYHIKLYWVHFSMGRRYGHKTFECNCCTRYSKTSQSDHWFQYKVYWLDGFGVWVQKPYLKVLWLQRQKSLWLQALIS